ncbi:MAG: NAD-dependent epimerase/dehydratase family protein [Candidatus Gottesmanbacteria bacterium]|nr:NAD-dependent epimerase/dehydratase family protein [Candidatus Gottesmanbacteria bacterium]
MAIIFPHDVVRIDVEYITEQASSEFAAMAGTKLLLTGAGGFLGYYCIWAIAYWNEHHPKQKISLTALSRFREGIPTWLAHLVKTDDIRVVSSDVTRDPLLADGPYDYIIHAASFASPMVYRQYPIETMTANVLGLYRILDQLVKTKSSRTKLKKLLYFSSSEIYGDPPAERIPTSEDYRGNVSCTGPRACYDESKRFCETLCVNFVRIHGIPIVTVRPFNNYGPGMKITDGRVIADFARNILSGEDIVMHSTGAPSRTFCYVADAMIGYIKALVNGTSGEAYNIGIELPEVSVADLASRIAILAKEHFGYGGRVQQSKSEDKDYLTDNPQRRRPSIQKAKQELGYDPKISLEEGLTRTLQWYQATGRKK